MGTRGRGGFRVLLADQAARVGQPHTFSSYGIQFQVTGFCGGQKVRSVPAGPGEKPGTIFRRLLEDKELTGLARVAVMKIIGDTELLKNKSGFVIV
jgi:hypothetical protein